MGGPVGRSRTICKKYKAKTFEENKILTRTSALVWTGTSTAETDTLVCGGSGAGKTLFFAEPNVMQANTSMVILDPKGEIARATGHLWRPRAMRCASWI